MRQHYSRVLVAFFLCLITSACAPVPTKETSVVYLSHTPTFPYVLLDFGSAEVKLVELDGKKTFEVAFVELPSGEHSFIVEAAKGPTGMFGVAAFVGRCQSKFDLDLLAGKTYAFKFIRTEGSEVIQWMDRGGKRIISEAPCIKIE
jgi:hypothetical protein